MAAGAGAAPDAGELDEPPAHATTIVVVTRAKRVLDVRRAWSPPGRGRAGVKCL